MQTSKYEIGANLQGLEFRRQVNEILAALASSNAGNLEPVAAQAGTVWLDTSNDKKHLLKIRNKANSAWGILCSIDAQSGAVDAIDAYNKQESDERYAQKSEITDGLKIGSYLLWSSQSVTPAGFLVCDGRSLKKSEYAELFAVIGYAYGGSGDDFNIPIFNDGRFFRSAGGQASALGVKQKGSPHIIDVRNDAVWALGLQAPVADVDSLGFDKLTDGINNKLFAGYGQMLGAYAADTVAKIYPDQVQTVAIRPENSSMVVLIKAKDVKEPNTNQIDKSIYATETKAGITKLKNSVTGKAEDTAITEKAASEIKGQILGVSQEYKNLIGQKRGNEIYTNDTGRPIYVNIGIKANGPGERNLKINGVIVDTAAIGAAQQLPNTLLVKGIVPPGATYSVDGTVNFWFELR